MAGFSHGETIHRCITVYVSILILLVIATAGSALGGIIAHYPLDGTADDIIGNLDGTIIGASTTVDRFGNSASAMSFDGVDDHVSLPLAAAFDLDQGTISLWFKADKNFSAQSAPFAMFASDNSKLFKISIDQREHIDTQDIFAILREDPQDVFWQIQIPEGIFDSHSNLSWNHVAVTHDGASPRFFLNGTEVGDFSGQTPAEWWARIFDDIDFMGLGRSNENGTTAPFDGAIDDVQIYDSALSAQEIRDLAADSIFHDGFESGDTSGWGAQSR